MNATHTHPIGASSASADRQAPSWPTLLAGGALIFIGLRRRSPLGLALSAAGAGVTYRAARGSWPFIQRSATPRTMRGNVTINRPAAELYRLWSEPEGLSDLLPHVEALSSVDDDVWRWVIAGPMRQQAVWETEITAREPHKRIAWRSLRGPLEPLSGNVALREPGGDRGTEVAVEIEFQPPRGIAGSLTSLLAGVPEQWLRSDLMRMKQQLEAGEAPTTRGQPRGSLGSALQKGFHR